MAYYLIKSGKKGLAIGLIVGNFVLFASVITSLEVLYQKKIKEPLIKLTDLIANHISVAEFDKMVLEGRMLMILEGFVLDIEPYLYYHPGGVFVLS